ncbi:hypothetical protein GQ600_16752 [Phytophthora cactorum]|nr:hypothetical protein GQ600_16752 [Phytophthora cactorum]
MAFGDVTRHMAFAIASGAGARRLKTRGRSLAVLGHCQWWHLL